MGTEVPIKQQCPKCIEAKLTQLNSQLKELYNVVLVTKTCIMTTTHFMCPFNWGRASPKNMPKTQGIPEIHSFCLFTMFRLLPKYATCYYFKKARQIDIHFLNKKHHIWYCTKYFLEFWVLSLSLSIGVNYWKKGMKIFPVRQTVIIMTNVLKSEIHCLMQFTDLI